MTKVRMLLVGSLTAAALVAPAAPAHASCQTELGDMCKLVEVVCNTSVGQKFIPRCR
ncbi:MAG TPA: hypothetical protein VEV43_09575 [Actinomycetota bacterium]|nr:hypothetical protein [Actinomycetota bacterium]